QMFTKHRGLPFVTAAIGLGAKLTTAYYAIQLYRLSKMRKTKAIITNGKEHGEPDGNLVPQSKPDEVIMTIDELNDIHLVLQSEPDAATLAKHQTCLNKFAQDAFFI
ncbi:hypothetical protein H0H92_008034, partial [Tricholoma furcatifolium]